MAEIITCTNCQRSLQIPEQYVGQKVQCPDCGHMFTAAANSVSAEPIPPPPSTGGGYSSRTTDRRVEDDDDDPPARRRNRFGDEDDDPPARRRNRFGDEDEEFNDFRSVRRSRQHLEPHRGGLIVALGLISLIGGLAVCGLLLFMGPVAWIMGSADLRAMSEGRMDPSGQGNVRAGQVCGIISTVILLLGVVLLGCFILVAVAGKH